ncbi:alpha/beta hydrolase [Crossiella sp. NPDC003009]
MPHRRYLLATAAVALLATTAAPATAEPTSERPQWTDCDGQPGTPQECATLTVPLDYRHPGGRKIQIAISRIKAADPAKRHGILLTNPGGPGGAGLDLPSDLHGRLPKDVLDRFDLIGMDPRGIGQSGQVACGQTGSLFEVTWPRHPGKHGFAADARAAADLAQQCYRRFGDLAPFLTTRNVARDLDAVRAALGERTASYFGTSYGTYLGAVYTQLFPERADRVVLDSAVDPASAWRQSFRNWGPVNEQALADWADWTVRNGAPLGQTAERVRARLDALLPKLDRNPVKHGSFTFTGEVLRPVVRGVLYDERDNPALAALIGDLDRGALRDPAAIALADQVAALPPADELFSGHLAVACDDAEWPRDPARYAVDSALDGRKYPFFGAAAGNIHPCAFWPGKPVEPPAQVVPGRAKSVLIVQASGDTSTPLVGAQGLRRALGDQARLVLLENTRVHGVYANFGNACVDAEVTGYLIAGALPAKDVSCRK